MWLAVIALGCAPAYRPPTAFVPLLAERGDVHVAGQLGTGGLQADVAYAPATHLAVRGGGQFGGYLGDGTYVTGNVGAGPYGTWGNGGTWAVTAVAGAGYSHGQTTLSVQTNDARTETVFRNSGVLLTGAIRGEWGIEGESFGWGGQLGPTWHLLSHDGASDGTGVGQMWMLEGATVIRGGPPGPIRAQGTLGVAFPLWADPVDGVGVPIPIVLGLGVTGDLPRR